MKKRPEGDTGSSSRKQTSWKDIGLASEDCEEPPLPSCVKLWAMRDLNSCCCNSSLFSPCTCLIIALTEVLSAYNWEQSYSDKNIYIQLLKSCFWIRHGQSWAVSHCPTRRGGYLAFMQTLKPSILKALTSSEISKAPEPSSSSSLKHSVISLSCVAVRGPADKVVNHDKDSKVWRPNEV